MKKILLAILILVPGISFAGNRVKNLSRIDIPAQNLLDATTLGITMTPLASTTCYMGTASGCSITAFLVPASTSAAFVTNFKIPNNYGGNGKFYLVAKTESNLDTTCQIKLDIQVQELNSLTVTTVTVGTASTAVVAANGSQWCEIELPNNASFGPGSLLNLYLSRAAGTTSTLDVLELVFWYKPLALISR